MRPVYGLSRLAIWLSAFIPFCAIAQQLPDYSSDIVVAYQGIGELIGSPVKLKISGTTSLGGQQIWNIAALEAGGNFVPLMTGTRWRVKSLPVAKVDPKLPRTSNDGLDQLCNRDGSGGMTIDALYNQMAINGYHLEGNFIAENLNPPQELNLFVLNQGFTFARVFPRENRACQVYVGANWKHNFQRVP